MSVFCGWLILLSTLSSFLSPVSPLCSAAPLQDSGRNLLDFLASNLCKYLVLLSFFIFWSLCFFPDCILDGPACLLPLVSSLLVLDPHTGLASLFARSPRGPLQPLQKSSVSSSRTSSSQFLKSLLMRSSER